MNTSATILRIQKSAGIAGQVSYVAHVQHAGEEPTAVTFVGSAFGGPVVMVSESGAQCFVKDAWRFGAHFGPEWVRRFFN